MEGIIGVKPEAEHVETAYCCDSRTLKAKQVLPYVITRSHDHASHNLKEDKFA